jgi:signal-transduction protein with cAMP-binding, CBS, and nucleotidyltransferase domain
MIKPVLKIDINKNVRDAGKTMAQARRGTLIVTKGNNPIGIITDSDVIKKVVAKNLKPSSIKVKQLMSKPLITVDPEDTVLDATRKMKKNNVKRLPVVSEGKLIGVISATDIARTSPELLDILEFKLKTRESPITIQEATTSGICDSCENYHDDLKKVGNQWLCEYCREDLEEEE